MMPSLLHVSALLTAGCVAGLWQGLVMVLMGITLCSLMPRASASLRHSLLIAMFTGALFLPFISFHGGEAGSGQHSFQLAPWVGAAIAAVWLAAAAFRSVQLYFAWHHLCAVQRAAIPVQVQGTTAFAAGSRRAILCSSPDVDSPTILGFRSPRLLLPDWLVPRLSESELQQIALHECEHLRRGDDWMNLVLQVGLILSPLNPGLFWLNRIISKERELAVDSAVVAQTGKPLAYAACLTRLAEQRLGHSRLRLALTAWERKSELVQRVHALLDQSSTWTQAQSAWATATAAAVLLTAVSGMVHIPQLVHVGDEPVQVAATKASVVPVMNVATVPTSNQMDTFTGARAEPASFRVRSARFIKVRATHKKAFRKMTGLSTDSRDFTVPNSKHAPMMMRTHYTPSGDVSTIEDDSASPATEPVRLTPAVFYRHYVAVPVSSGWLLIEL
ncbi:M56 family metallopeptidase [Terriglobus saanensis]|uniref:Peptidase M56 BlaR1 n=1 Tax=Terriglobus saanensis (strain ATCC BAA-1853 / DSM 23119 / SP1PR4) TaxID=401053 RepID=E8V3A4_TERSS|nr:M56 family metallopeptidase [Terriglobus saanensis]ADV82461.1 peptidase M56 BlaR1 [Terriglobus saanensis SP1PR4]